MRNNKIYNFKLSINNKKIIDSKYSFGPIEANKKCTNFFNLPKSIQVEYFLKYGNLRDRPEYTLAFHTNNEPSQYRIEELIAEQYFDLYKIASSSNYFIELSNFAKECINKIIPLMVKSNILNPNTNITAFNWNNKLTKTNVSMILKKLIESHIQLRELKRRLIKNKLIKVLEENRNNPYFLEN